MIREHELDRMVVQSARNAIVSMGRFSIDVVHPESSSSCC